MSFDQRRISARSVSVLLRHRWALGVPLSVAARMELLETGTLLQADEWAAVGFGVNDECLEVEMSQDTDGSGLISLLWALWIYWNIYWWHEHLSALKKAEKERRHGIAREMIKAVVASSDLEALVSQILQRDGGTAVEDFLDQRLAAYESIVAAFDSGDRKTLRKLVSPELYDAFSDAIEARQEITRTVFSGIDLPEILAGLLDETHMEVSIRFVAESFKLPCKDLGQSIVRMPGRRRSVDIWTFARILSSPDGEWRLVATEAGV